jgi:hypothetical protein
LLIINGLLLARKLRSFLAQAIASGTKVMSYFANPLTDYSPQLEMGGSAFSEAGSEQSTSPLFDEDDEVELASEFLEVANERDLDHFIGKLTDRASLAIDADLDGPVERDLGDIFKESLRPYCRWPAAHLASSLAARLARRWAADWHPLSDTHWASNWRA